MDILIVEDNPEFRRVVRAILAAEFPSLHIAEAEEGGCAIHLVEEGRPGMVLMDIQLPGENGLSLTRRIKESFPEVGVVILSSHESEEYRQAAYASGADAFLGKSEADGAQIAGLVRRFGGRKKTLPF